MAEVVAFSSNNGGNPVGFLKALAYDDAFRSRAEQAPRAAMEEFGISAAGVPEQVSLPSKEELQRSLSAAGIDSGSDVTVAAAHIAFLAFFAFMK